MDQDRTWVAPNVWAAVVGALLLLVALALSGPAIVRWIVAGSGAILIVYFLVGYAAAARRGEVPARDDDDPPGGWSNQGPYTSA